MAFETRQSVMQCLYCGGECQNPDREHIPPRSFLEKPYPPNLATTVVCATCNRQFSMDEQYAVALLAQIGTTAALEAKVDEGGCVDRAFLRRPSFEERFLDRLHIDEDGRIYIEPEMERLHTVLKKVVSGLYWLRYKNRIAHDDIGPVKVLLCDAEDSESQFVTRYVVSIPSTAWTIVQENVFEYMFPPLDEGQMCCLIRWHNTMWILCGVPCSTAVVGG